MKTFPLVLSAALLSFASTANAASRDVSDYLDKAGAVATAELKAAGVSTDGGLTLRARVVSDGRLANARLVGSSGSAETDHRAAAALRNLRVGTPPNVLIGADVKIAVGATPVQQAKVP